MFRILAVVTLVAGGCGGGDAASSTTTPPATITTAMTTTTVGTTTTVAPAAIVMPAPIPLPMRTFTGAAAPDTGFSLTLFVGSPLKGAIGAANGFPDGCVGLSLFSPDYTMRYFDGYVPTVTGGCDGMEGVLPDDAILARTDRSIVVEMGELPELPFIPAFQVSLVGAASGWYSLPPMDPVDPASVPEVPAEGYLTHAGGGLFALPAWDPIVLPPIEPGTCTPAEHTLCLGGGRFRVEAGFTGSDGSPARASGGATDGDGTFWFFDQDNVDLVIKVLNGCSIDGRYWVFAGGLTGIPNSITIEDTRTATTTVMLGDGPTPLIGAISDTDAFATCP